MYLASLWFQILQWMFCLWKVNIHGSAISVQMVQQRSDSIHVWHPLCSFTAYLIAWYGQLTFCDGVLLLCISRLLPAFIIMIPFGVMSSYYDLVRLTNSCSCWWARYTLPVYASDQHSIYPPGACPILEMWFLGQTLGFTIPIWK